MSITFYDLSGLEGRRFSPFGWRARMALAHKGLEVDAKVIRVGFNEKHKIEFSGQQLVPVLVDHAHDDRVICDSWKIAEYLEETYSSDIPLLGGPHARGLARTVTAWVDTQLHPRLVTMVIRDILDYTEPVDHAYFRENREKRFGATLEEVQAGREDRLPDFRQALQPARVVLSEQPFIGGEAPNYGDYAVFGAFAWARVVSAFKLLENDDPIHAWRERMLDLFDGMPRTEPGFPV